MLQRRFLYLSFDFLLWKTGFGICGCLDFLTEGTSAESMAAYLMLHAWHDRLDHCGK